MDNSETGDAVSSPFAGERLVNTRQTAHEYVRGVIRRAILKGELEAGSRLVQADLASMLGVSTTPVREALRDLASEGLVQFDPHRGAIVSALSTKDLHEIYEIRSVLEPLAMRQAVPKLTDAAMLRIRSLHDQMTEEPNGPDWVDHNRDFHMTVYESGASARLTALIRSLQDASVMYIGASMKDNPNLRQEANHDHEAILDALEKRDVELAVAALKRHLQTTVNAFEGLQRSQQV